MRQVVTFFAILIALSFPPALAHADGSYHSAHIPLHSINSEPLAGGFVQNIHPNGPNVYAHEVYVLRGAEPREEYEVRLLAYLFAPDCSGDATDFGAVSLVTNPSGNGSADRFFAPSDVPDALRHATHGVRWEVQLDGATVYATGCNAIALD